MWLELNNPDLIFGRALNNIYHGVETAAGPGGSVFPVGQEQSRAMMAQAVNIFRDLELTPALSVIKISGIIATAVFGFLFVWMIIRMNRYWGQKAAALKAQMNPPQKAEGGVFDARWKEVREHLESFRDVEWKFAVIEADRMLNDILEKAGFVGEGLGEKLTLMNKNELVFLDEVWEAHRLRNTIVHDDQYRIRRDEARRAVNYFEKALRELGTLGD